MKLKEWLRYYGLELLGYLLYPIVVWGYPVWEWLILKYLAFKERSELIYLRQVFLSGRRYFSRLKGLLGKLKYLYIKNLFSIVWFRLKNFIGGFLILYTYPRAIYHNFFYKNGKIFALQFGPLLHVVDYFYPIIEPFYYFDKEWYPTDDIAFFDKRAYKASKQKFFLALLNNWDKWLLNALLFPFKVTYRHAYKIFFLPYYFAGEAKRESFSKGLYKFPIQIAEMRAEQRRIEREKRREEEAKERLEETYKKRFAKTFTKILNQPQEAYFSFQEKGQLPFVGKDFSGKTAKDMQTRPFPHLSEVKREEFAVGYPCDT